MDTSAYQKITINQFKGLYKRGLPDNCPQDHAICCENLSFNKRGEALTRDGMIASENCGHDVARMFLAVTSNGDFLLTLDELGNIYQNNDPAPIFSAPNVIDFSALNLAGFTYILPIVAPGNTPPNLQVWDGILPTSRDAAGNKPAGIMVASDGAAGDIDVGTYQIAVSYITNTGFTTPPSLLTTYNAPGNKQIDLSNIPTGGPEVIARQILITRSNELELFFIGESEGGFINDNVTTATILDFFDTDLSISADYLNDLYEKIPGAIISGNLIYYHSRLCITNNTEVVKVSRVQDQESINQVDGLLQFPCEGGQGIYGLCTQQDVLYATSFPGIFMAEDNTLEPAFWPITLIDGGVGSFGPGIGTLSGTTNALSSRQTFLISDRNGIYAFNGRVEGAALTWKIDDIWKQINFEQAQKITLLIDIFHDIFYVIAPVGDATLPSILLMADYSEGLDWQNIKWCYWTFPYDVISATIINFTGNLEPGTGGYFLRIAFQGSPQDNFIYAIKPGQTSDQGSMINSYYTTYLSTVEEGTVNIFRNTRFRAEGIGPLALQLNVQNFNASFLISPPNLTLSLTNPADLDRQINFVAEKMALTFGVDTVSGNPGDLFKIARVDIFGKRQFMSRPQ